MTPEVLDDEDKSILRKPTKEQQHGEVKRYTKEEIQEYTRQKNMKEVGNPLEL